MCLERGETGKKKKKLIHNNYKYNVNNRPIKANAQNIINTYWKDYQQMSARIRKYFSVVNVIHVIKSTLIHFSAIFGIL